MRKFNYIYDILSNKKLNYEDKNHILNICSSEEIENFIFMIYNDLLNQAQNKNKKDEDIMKEVRVYKLLKEEQEKRSINKNKIE